MHSALCQSAYTFSSTSKLRLKCYINSWLILTLLMIILGGKKIRTHVSESEGSVFLLTFNVKFLFNQCMLRSWPARVRLRFKMYHGGDRGGEQTEARLKFRADYLNVGNLQRSQLEEHISRNTGKRFDFFFPHTKCKEYPTLFKLYFIFFCMFLLCLCLYVFFLFVYLMNSFFFFRMRNILALLCVFLMAADQSTILLTKGESIKNTIHNIVNIAQITLVHIKKLKVPIYWLFLC